MARSFVEVIRRKSAFTPIAVALDSPLDEAVEGVLARLGSDPHPPPVKVGWAPILRDGLAVLATVRRATPASELIVDVKIADVPHVSRAVAGDIFEAGADAVIVHGFMGRDAVAGVLEAADARGGGGGVLVVAETSNPGASLCYQGCATSILSMVRELGVDGVIAPATRPQRIAEFRRALGDGPLILSPGVGAQGGDAAVTIDMGADMVIVGRSIMGAQDPLAELRRMRDEIATRSRAGSRSASGR